MRILVRSRSNAQLGHAVAVLPRWISGKRRVRESSVRSGKGVVGSLVGKILVGPDLADYLDRFLEQLPVLHVIAGVRVGVKLRPLVWPDAASKAYFEAASAHVVQYSQVLGEPDRMPPGGDIRHLADADSGGAGG